MPSGSPTLLAISDSDFFIRISILFDYQTFANLLKPPCVNTQVLAPCVKFYHNGLQSV